MLAVVIDFVDTFNFKFSEFIHKDSAKVNVSKAFIANDALLQVQAIIAMQRRP